MPCVTVETVLEHEYRWPAAAARAVGRYVAKESGCRGRPLAQPRLCGGPCFGGYQWSAARWRQAVTWMTARGLDPWSLEAQTHYAVAEFLAGWPRAARRLAEGCGEYGEP